MGMRNILVFLDESDAQNVFCWLSDHPDLAILWLVDETPESVLEAEEVALKQYRDGEISDDDLDAVYNGHHWRAYDRMEPRGDYTYCLWHKPTGPVQLVRDETLLDVANPFLGWRTRRYANAEAPWNGDGAQYLFFELNTQNPNNGDLPNLSSFSVGGGRYDPVPETLDAFWKALRSFINKGGTKVNGVSLGLAPDMKYCCWPGALRRFECKQP